MNRAEFEADLRREGYEVRAGDAALLRHSFATVAADLGYSEPTIAALVGHKGQSPSS
jgi:hypothetical protein